MHAVILSNVLRAHLADTPTYDDEAQTCARGSYSQFCSGSPWVDIIPTRVISDEWFLIRTKLQS